MAKIRAGLAGAAGYAGGELLRLLLLHPEVDIAFAQSTSQAGRYLYEVYPDLFDETNLKFSREIHLGIDVLFLCMAHGESKRFMEQNAIPESITIIDLSQDFRLDGGFIYGIPEVNREKIRNHTRIANPGCFATCILLGLLPLAGAGQLQKEIHINATTGSTGAGRTLNETSHFSWRSGNLSIYKSFRHQHLAEIVATLSGLQSEGEIGINFIPARGSFTRGIFAVMYMDTALSLNDCTELYNTYYSGHPFVNITPFIPDVKQVVNTNKCYIHLEKHDNKLLITSVIDNLLKGASGQAVQNMNLAFGLEETTGLKLKAVAF